ncbi:MAG: GNAT family N-acetyltransferase [Halovenus sp.]
MNVRQASAGDSDRIREIAEQSFQASYALSPLDIEGIIELEFTSDRIGSRLDDGLILVAEGDDGAILGFVEGVVTDEGCGEIRWLHVAPTERGYGVGTELFERVLTALRERMVDEIHATVLADNQEGGEFFQQFEFESQETVDREFDERTLTVELYRNEHIEPKDEDE